MRRDERPFWERVDPAAYRQGWDAAAKGRDKYLANEYLGTGPRAAFEAGYEDFEREPTKDPT